jgi:CRP-like cAMP-binding protein
MRKIPCDKCATRRACVIADLPDEKADAFRCSANTALYRARQVIFHHGTPASGLYLLCHGAVKLYQSDCFGRDHIVAVARPGDVLGELPTDPTEPYAVSAEALSDSQICYLSRQRLAQLVHLHPAAGVRLIGALSTMLSAARKKLRAFALKKAESRLAELLLELAAAENGNGNGKGPYSGIMRVMLRYSRRQIGEMIGVSTETAIRLFGQLKQTRAISIDHREVVIADVEKLVRIAHQDEILARQGLAP